MSVTERGRGWQVYVKVGDRRYRVMASTEAKGKAMEAEIRAAIEAGREYLHGLYRLHRLALHRLVGNTVQRRRHSRYASPLTNSGRPI